MRTNMQKELIYSENQIIEKYRALKGVKYVEA